MLITTPMRV